MSSHPLSAWWDLDGTDPKKTSLRRVFFVIPYVSIRPFPDRDLYVPNASDTSVLVVKIPGDSLEKRIHWQSFLVPSFPAITVRHELTENIVCRCIRKLEEVQSADFSKRGRVWEYFSWNEPRLITRSDIFRMPPCSFRSNGFPFPSKRTR